MLAQFHKQKMSIANRAAMNEAQLIITIITVIIQWELNIRFQSKDAVTVIV